MYFSTNTTGLMWRSEDKTSCGNWFSPPNSTIWVLGIKLSFPCLVAELSTGFVYCLFLHNARESVAVLWVSHWVQWCNFPVSIAVSRYLSFFFFSRLPTAPSSPHNTVSLFPPPSSRSAGITDMCPQSRTSIRIPVIQTHIVRFEFKLYLCNKQVLLFWTI